MNLKEKLNKRTVHTYHCKVWDGEVNLLEWNHRQRTAFCKQAIANKDNLDKNFQFCNEAVASSLCEQDGTLCFTPQQVDDLDGTAVEEVFQEVLRINGMSSKAVEEKKSD